MPVTRTRKLHGPEHSKQTSSTASQKSISQYGRVTKNQRTDPSSKKRKSVLEDAVKAISPLDLAEKIIKKEEQPQRVQPTTQATQALDSNANEPSARPTRKRRHEETIETPQHKRFRDTIPLTPAETPSKAAVHLFDRLSIETASGKTPSKLEAVYDTPPLTPRSFADLSTTLPTLGELPPDLQDMIRLFSAFLTSTSLFYAHHGFGTPLQMAFVLQNVAKAWKKRSVTETDIRRLLGLTGDSEFEIVDNGDGMVCLEQIGTLAPGRFNQPAMKQQFEDKLRRLWKDWTSISANRKHEAERFVAQLPLADVHEGDFAPSKDAKPSKGQSLLDDIKKSAAQAQSEKLASQKTVVTTQGKSAAGVLGRGNSLLDRILAKEQLNSSRASGPTKEEMERRAALNRIEDVIPVLDLLAGSRPRVSFSTQTLVSNLQNSLRNPISREEAEQCLELMAVEITPTFVTMIKAGQVKGVVITKGGRPSNAELRQRLELAGGGASGT